MKVTGKIVPIKNNVLISDMEFGEETSKGGIVMLSANGKSEGIHPRWGKVWAVGPQQHDIKVGEWILIEHGRWTRTIEFETEDGEMLELRMVELKSVLMSADEKPVGAMRNAAIGAGSNVNFNIPGA
jgi:co-chaperonin GroES (HSP10)